jgi:hypothetical protein
LSWADLELAEPELAAEGRRRLHGRVAYLATISPRGIPRAHPVTPIIGDGRLFVFMEPTSPKGHDLRKGSGYALHCGVEDNDGGEGEFLVTGRGTAIDGEDSETRATAAGLATYPPADRYVLFELSVESAMGTTYGQAGPRRRRWRKQG